MQYIPTGADDRARMLRAIGVESFEDLIANVPKALRLARLDLPAGISELELDREFDEIGSANKNFKYHTPYIGAGNYDHFIPAAVDRLAMRGEFLTAYTPYQGEASQGTLQALYEYQSLISELTAMDFSNGSMYDGASSLAEAALLAVRSTGRRKVILPEAVHPEYAAVVRTYLSHLGTEVITAPLVDGGTDAAALERLVGADTAAVIFQQPNFFGFLEDARALADAAHAAGALAIACVNPISLGIVAPPGEYGADIAVGEGQPLGNPVSFGGPHFGFFTVKAELLRKIPGRIAGVSVDADGERAFVLTLQAREQHIRREKATSNICTNQALCALRGAVYLALLGRPGIRKVALLNLQNAAETCKRLLAIRGVERFSARPFFNEFTLRIRKDKARLEASLKKHGILGPLCLERFGPYPDAWLVAVTEKRTAADLERLARAVEEA